MPAEPAPFREATPGRGAIAAAMLLVALLALAPRGADAQAGDYFKVVDLDADGRISLDEFLERMSWAFRQRDANGNGVLDPEEQHVPGAKPITLADHHARLTLQFRRQDGNSDGYLTPAEFLAPPR